MKYKVLFSLKDKSKKKKKLKCHLLQFLFGTLSTNGLLHCVSTCI